MRIPVATYRLQFKASFGFKDALGVVEYLSMLGISDIYASPIFKARKGSAHGYDVVDPCKLNPELGTLHFEKLMQELKEYEMGWIQDIVPNHMAYDSENMMLMDVLKKGRDSLFFDYFDIDWNHPDFNGKLLAPFLGKFYRECLKNREIKLGCDESGFFISYYDMRFPLSTESYAEVPAHDVESFELLHNLLSLQVFRLSFWKVANEKINYRRFFDINELISLRVEEEKVFLDIHRLIFKLVEERKISGLRIDHVDGLYDPAQYLRRVKEKAGVYLVVEKILGFAEELPSFWNVEGTTGYDFLNYVNHIFCRSENAKKFDRVYFKFTGFRATYEELLREKKRLILEKHIAGELENLARLLENISGNHCSDFTLYGLKRALIEVLVHFPIYRTYMSSKESRKRDISCIKEVIKKSKRGAPELSYEFNFIEEVLFSKKWLHFAMKFQQLTPVLMAKGFEDTFLYVYNRLISLNEVGGNPERFGITIKEFHDLNLKRINSYPHSMNTTSTHDTKRGEDVRARINVLSEMPDEWEKNIKKWSKITRNIKRSINNTFVPDRNEEYLLYQTLTGAFPFDESKYSEFTERIKNYIIKALRDSKVNSSWVAPNKEYEDAFLYFVEEVLKPESLFMKEFLPFQKKIALYGIFNSISQTLITVTSPGVPCFYQGAELWDLNLVDPDNRGAVDFEKRKKFLQEIKYKEKDILKLIDELLLTKEDGRIKLFLIYRALEARKKNIEVFQKGSYIQLEVAGELKEHVIAFARRYENSWAVALAPRFLVDIIREDESPIGMQVWKDTYIIMPEDAPELWKDAVTSNLIKGRKALYIGKALERFPVSLLMSEERR